MPEKRKLTSVAALKEYFDEPRVTLSELKALSKTERDELGQLAAEALNAEWVPYQPQ